MPEKRCNSSRVRRKVSSKRACGWAARRASRSPTWVRENRTLSPASLPTPARPPYLRSHSSGSMPKVPSSSWTSESPFTQGGQEPRQWRADAAEVGLDVQVEPVDAAGHFDVEMPVGAVELSFGL